MSTLSAFPCEMRNRIYEECLLDAVEKAPTSHPPRPRLASAGYIGFAATSRQVAGEVAEAAKTLIPGYERYIAKRAAALKAGPVKQGEGSPQFLEARQKWLADVVALDVVREELERLRGMRGEARALAAGFPPKRQAVEEVMVDGEWVPLTKA